jgi:O-antigen/teichoic acid export membrane protein
LALIVILFAFGWRLWAVVGGTTLAAMTAAAVLAWLARRDLASTATARPLADLRHLQVVRYSLVLSVSTIVVFLGRSCDLLMLGHFRTAGEAGQYSVAQMAVILIGLFGNAIGQTTGPRIAALHSEGDRAGMSALMVRQARWAALLSVPLCAIMTTWGHRLLLIFGSSFLIDWRVLGLLAFNQYVLAVLAPSGWLLSMTGHHRAELRVMVMGLIMMLVLGYGLIPVHGQLGAAMAVLAASLVANLTRVAIGFRRMGIRAVGRQHLWLTLWPLALAAVVEWLRRQVHGEASILEAVLVAVVYLCIYAGLTWKFGLTNAEREALLKRWTKRVAGS